MTGVGTGVAGTVRSESLRSEITGRDELVPISHPSFAELTKGTGSHRLMTTSLRALIVRRSLSLVVEELTEMDLTERY